jgi:hypothetical protein
LYHFVILLHVKKNKIEDRRRLWTSGMYNVL